LAETKIFYGKKYADMIKEGVKDAVNELKAHDVTPGLAVILVGDDEASKIYVRNKHKICLELGIKSFELSLPKDITKEELLSEIEKLNNDNDVNGILLQLPLPDHLKQYELEMLSKINPNKDVDGFNPVNTGLVSNGNFFVAPCTPLGIIKMLEIENVSLKGLHAVVIGRSNIVGKPMAQLLLSKDCTVTVCHSKTENLKEIVKTADIIVTAVGKPKFVTADMVKKDAIVIDVGINRIDGHLVGDVDFDNVKDIASCITPVPGGCGLLTTATLMFNVTKLTYLMHPEIE
jgi:methylenetetrahydrofolate dehydrogenase (NADP+)/methenyltetrahydrofolate cyclohydrolase